MTSIADSRLGPILLVEDDDHVGEMLNVHFMRLGYLLQRANSLQDARARLRWEAPAAVLLDLLLPDGHGFQLLGDIRDLGLDVPVIVVSGADETVLIEAISVQGADDYVCKPIDLRVLTARLMARLRRRRMIHVHDGSSLPSKMNHDASTNRGRVAEMIVDETQAGPIASSIVRVVLTAPACISREIELASHLRVSPSLLRYWWRKDLGSRMSLTLKQFLRWARWLRAVEMRDAGATITEIAERLGVDEATVYRDFRCWPSDAKSGAVEQAECLVPSGQQPRAAQL